MVLYLAIALILAALGAGLVFMAVTVLKKKFLGSSSADKDNLLREINETTSKTRELLQRKDGFASRGQLEYLTSLLTSAQSDLEREKAALKEIEEKLGGSQKVVEEKETHQQDIKSAKMEDEAKLQDLLAAYENLSSEAIALEQKLALSLKNLDAIMDQLELTQDQKAVLQELSNALTNAGARLRDLLTEYEQVNERLLALQQQHLDLEDEYTKLVEQQLGD